MKILYYSYEFPPFHVGGLGTYAQEMAKMFVKRDHSVTAFSKNPGDAPTHEIWKGIEVHRPLLADIVDLLPILMPGDVSHWPTSSQEYFAEVLMYNMLSATKTVNDLVSKDDREFDIIVAHDWLSAIAGIATKRELDLPFVFHVHSTEQGRTRDGSETIKSLERSAARISDLVITVSDAMKGQLISLGYNPEKIRAIPNGVDHEKYDPNRKEFSEDKNKEFREKIGVGDDPMILFVGRLTWVKGVESLTKAMPTILSEIPDAKLVILGQGDQENAVRDVIENNDLHENVITHFKWVEEEERLKYYAASDLCVFPSRYEPFGIVCTEAMSMGKPVVVGAKGTCGFREQVITSGADRCGSHVDPDSPHDIAEFVIEILKDDDLRERMGNNARQRVLDNYTLDSVADRTLNTYEKLIEE
ncbi:glycosyl transferase family 1 [candidate division MSBL1 archaeon SCGC-AAA259E19]|uniref:Glycosyl transferase family 1 n=1 Tax=candidate division MSBL1 archaeon SCGC-AAA259E19 TaxID=1698264 RepID=A0A133UL58_9EURY|nr:glycosyl transferase family 1 [candidate division MSBL1 archaeon SCGC-AAA259E19]